MSDLKVEVIYKELVIPCPPPTPHYPITDCVIFG